MKVMFVIGILSNGGAERVISVVAEELSKKGYEVSIVTLYDRTNTYVKEEKVRLLSVEHKYRNRIIRAFENINGLRRLMKKEKPDIVISFVWQINVYSIIASIFTKTKLIISERNDPIHDPKSKYLRKIRDFMYQFSNGHVFQTENAKNYFSTKIRKNGTVIPNPIKEDLPFWDKDNNSKVIITACRLSKQKNLPMLIDAFEKVLVNYPEYILKIFGEGELRQDLISYIESKGLSDKIFLPGFSENIYDEMANSELFVISSDYEGISNSMLEALAIGIPVISTDTPTGGGKMFITNDENGILVDVGNVNQLAVAINKVISDKSFAVHLSSQSRLIRKELSPSNIAEKWIEYSRDS